MEEVRERDYEILEEYVRHGMRRFKVRVKGSNMIFDVQADNAEEAIRRADDMARRMKKI